MILQIKSVLVSSSLAWQPGRIDGTALLQLSWLETHPSSFVPVLLLIWANGAKIPSRAALWVTLGPAPGAAAQHLGSDSLWLKG